MKYIVPNSKLTFRMNSQDIETIATVLYENVYRLPPKITGTVVDIGANIGCFTLACLARGADMVHAYEPHPDNYVLLDQNIRAYRHQEHLSPGNAATYRHAVWKPGVMHLDLVHCGEFTAMHTAVNRNDGDVVLKVPAASLDSILNLTGDVSILKLDCEGGEWPGLYECTTLRKCEEIIAELHPQLPVEGYVCTLEGITEFLASNGFTSEVIHKDEVVNGNVVIRAVRRET